MSDFAALLLDARKRAGLSQAELAHAAGLTPSYLCTIERRKKPPPSDEVCQRLAEVLGLPAAELIEVAHLERAPDALRKRLRALDRSLRHERKSSLRALRSLLSPFLFSGPPGYAESALDALAISRARRRRIRDVLDAVGRKHLDLEGEISRLVEDLPERERSALLDSLPQLLAEQARRSGAEPVLPEGAPAKGRPATPRLSHHPEGPAVPGVPGGPERPEPPDPRDALPGRAPVRGSAPPGPSELVADTSTGLLLLEVDEALAEGFSAPGPGDHIAVDPTLLAEDGDLIVVRDESGPRLRRLQRIGPMVRLATDEPTTRRGPEGGATPSPVDTADLLDESTFGAVWRSMGVGVVVEIRRRLRARGRPESGPSSQP